jgi:hypothetical protein
MKSSVSTMHRVIGLPLTGPVTMTNRFESIHPAAGFWDVTSTLARPSWLTGYVRPATLAAAAGAGAGTLWRKYASSWTRWNHLRTMTAIAGCVSLVLSLVA